MSFLLLFGRGRYRGPGGGHVTTFSVGVDFRATAGFVVDTAGNHFYSAGIYPDTTTIPGYSLGWQLVSGTTAGIDNNAALDKRLAGVVYVAAAAVNTFIIDLPAPGSYTVHIGAGGLTGLTPELNFQLWDGTATLLWDSGKVNITGLQFVDAQGNITSDTAWAAAGGGAARVATFATSQLRLKLSVQTTTQYSLISHLHVHN